jgi:hypothetical protein
MKFTLNKTNLYFYSAILLLFFFVIGALNPIKGFSPLVGSSVDQEQRVIKCELPLKPDLVQNVYYVADSLQSAKKLLFNSKDGLFFDNSLYIKTKDFNGVDHIVAFEDVTCDAVGTQVSLLNNGEGSI